MEHDLTAVFCRLRQAISVQGRLSAARTTISGPAGTQLLPRTSSALAHAWRSRHFVRQAKPLPAGKACLRQQAAGTLLC